MRWQLQFVKKVLVVTLTLKFRLGGLKLKTSIKQLKDSLPVKDPRARRIKLTICQSLYFSVESNLK
jgi:hypothetical protein